MDPDKKKMYSVDSGPEISSLHGRGYQLEQLYNKIYYFWTLSDNSFVFHTMLPGL